MTLNCIVINLWILPSLPVDDFKGNSHGGQYLKM